MLLHNYRENKRLNMYRTPSILRILTAVFVVLAVATSAAATETPDVFVQIGHLGRRITSVAFSPDGKHAFSGSWDKTIKIWDVSTGREIRTISEPRDKISSIAVSPSEKYILSAEEGMAGNIKLWDTVSGKKIRTFNSHNDTPFEIVVAVTPDGKYAISGAPDKTLKLWDIASGNEVRSFSGNTAGIASIAVTPDGKYVVAGSRDNAETTSGANVKSHDSTIRMWEISTGRQVMACNTGTGWVQAVAVSPDGKNLISADFDDSARMWELPSGKQVKVFQTGGAASVAISPDGKFVLFGGCEDLQLWDIASGKKIKVFKEPSGWVRSVAISPDGKYALSGSDSNAVKLWKIKPDKEMTTRFQQLRNWLSSKLGDSRSIEETDKPVRIFGGNARPVASVSVGTSGNTMLIGQNAGSLNFWDIANGRQIKTIHHTLGVTSAVISPDGTRAAAGGWDFPANRSVVKLWDIKTGKEISTLKNEGKYSDHWSRPFAFTRNNRDVLWSNGGVDLILSDIATGKEIKRLSEPRFDITNAMMSGDGRNAVSVNSLGWLYVWDVPANRLIKTFKGKSVGYGYTYEGGISGDGKTALFVNMIITGYSTARLIFRFWDFGKNKVVKTKVAKYDWSALPAGDGINRIDAVALSPDGRFALLGDFGSRELHLWDISGGKEIRIFKGPTNDISSMGISPNGKYVYSGSMDGTTRLWNISTGQEIAKFISFADGEWIAITPEGYYNASANGDKYLNVRIGNSVYGIENYREAFYRPNLVKLALAGGNLAGFRQLAEIKRAPAVSITNAAQTVNSDEATITLRIVDMGGGIGDVRLYLNGSAVVMDHPRGIGVVPKDDKAVYKSYTLRLTNGKNIIRAVVFNGDNTMQSNEALYETTAAFTSNTKPHLYALVVGINKFKNPRLQLNYAVADAGLFAVTLQKTSSDLYQKSTIKELVTPEKTTKANIVSELIKCQALKPDDVFVFYVASHGTVDDGEYFLITSNVGSTRTERLLTDAISQTTIKELIANIPATKKFIVLDTCNAGALGKEIQAEMMTRGMSEDTAVKILSRAVGSTILSASTSVQEALEGYKDHGLFTYVLTEGMMGKADEGRIGYVKTTSLADYVDNEVPMIAEKVFHRAQYPIISICGQGFPIGMVKQ
jgi:WD40 repeat protein